MRRLLGIVCVCASAAAWMSPALAAPTTVMFESLPTTPFDSYTEGLATFTAVDGSQLRKAYTLNGTWGIRSGTWPYAEMQADIAGGASSVSVDLGDKVGDDAETLFLEIFDAAGNSLGFTSQAIPADLSCMTTLSLSSPCIAYAVFGSRESTLNNGSSILADNFTYKPCSCPSAIPAPGGILLGMTGAGLIGLLRSAEHCRRIPKTPVQSVQAGWELSLVSRQQMIVAQAGRRRVVGFIVISNCAGNFPIDGGPREAEKGDMECTEASQRLWQLKPVLRLPRSWM